MDVRHRRVHDDRRVDFEHAALAKNRAPAREPARAARAPRGSRWAPVVACITASACADSCTHAGSSQCACREPLHGRVIRASGWPMRMVSTTCTRPASSSSPAADTQDHRRAHVEPAHLVALSRAGAARHALDRQLQRSPRTPRRDLAMPHGRHAADEQRADQDHREVSGPFSNRQTTRSLRANSRRPRPRSWRSR